MKLPRCMGLHHDLTIFGVVFVVAGGCCLGQEAEEATDEVWSIRSYQFPPNGLDVPWEDGQRLKLMDKPSVGAVDEEIEEYIRTSSSILAPVLSLNVGPFPKGSLMVADLEHGELAVRTAESMHALMELFEDNANRIPMPRVITCTLDVVEVDEAVASAVVDRALGTDDHKSIFRELEEKAVAGDAKWIATQRLDSESGQRAPIQSGGRTLSPQEVWIHADGTLAQTLTETAGEIEVEFDPLLSASGETVYLRCELQMASPAEGSRELVVMKGDGEGLVIPVEDRHIAELTTDVTIPNGGSRLAGMWDAEQEGRRRLAFISVNVFTPQLAKVGQAEQWLRAHGDQVEPLPSKTVYPPAPDDGVPWSIPEGMLGHVFNLGPGSFIVMQDNAPFLKRDGASADPFASDKVITRGMSPHHLLELAGIPFPKGAGAVFDPVKSTLVVVNHPEAIEQVRTLLEADLGQREKRITLVLRVVEANAREVREWSRKALTSDDHREMFKALVKGDHQMVTVAYVESKVGQRVGLKAGLRYPLWKSDIDGKAPSKPDEEAASTGSSHRLGDIEHRTVGLEWEMDTSISEENGTVDILMVLDFDTAPPVERGTGSGVSTQFFEEGLQTSLKMLDGENRLIGVWTPTTPNGEERRDVLHAVFLEVRVVDLGE